MEVIARSDTIFSQLIQLLTERLTFGAQEAERRTRPGEKTSLGSANTRRPQEPGRLFYFHWVGVTLPVGPGRRKTNEGSRWHPSRMLTQGRPVIRWYRSCLARPPATGLEASSFRSGIGQETDLERQDRRRAEPLCLKRELEVYSQAERDRRPTGARRERRRGASKETKRTKGQRLIPFGETHHFVILVIFVDDSFPFLGSEILRRSRAVIRLYDGAAPRKPVACILRPQSGPAPFPLIASSSKGGNGHPHSPQNQ
jgi:hypothetical protein